MILRGLRHWLLPKRLLGVSGLLSLTFFGLNHSWSHAAIVGAVAAEPCPAALVDRAEARVADLLGAVTARPWAVCMDRPALGLSVPFGTTRFAPFLPPIIVLGPQGQSLDVAAHEYLHAEVAARTGVLLRSYRIPTWFDEGLAMQVDTRPEYNTAALNRMLGRSGPPALNAMARPSQFFGQGTRSALYYAFARCVVGRALGETGIEGILDTLEDVSWTVPFPDEDFAPYADLCG